MDASWGETILFNMRTWPNIYVAKGNGACLFSLTIRVGGVAR